MKVQGPDREYRNLEERAYAYLKDKILLKELLPYEHITELGIAKELGISRTPVRRAIQKLEQNNYVKIESNRGATVNPPYIDSKNYIDRMEFLELLLVHAINYIEVKNSQVNKEKFDFLLKRMSDSVSRKEFSDYFQQERELILLFVGYTKNSYITEITSQTMIELITRANDDIQRVLQLNSVEMIKKFELVINHLANREFSQARRQIRAIMNHFMITAIR